MTKNVYFISLGCPKNRVDSEVMLGKLADANYQITHDPSLAEVIVVNTCSFIQSAKEESIETILEMAEYKDVGICKILVAAGCLPQRYAKELEAEIPEIDLLIGTGQYHRIIEFLDSFREQGSLPKRSYIDQPAFIHSENDYRKDAALGASAYLKISEGCNRRCSFCIIPKLRGFVRSRSVQSLVAEATQLAESGVRELNLVAQDLTHYGIDTRYQENLATLLPTLCQVEGIEWIRLHYVYPDQLSSEVIQIIAEQPKIVKYLDMPIQHTNNRILRAMNRRLTKERLFELIEELRSKIPNIKFRTSIVVGFPGETDKDFQELCDDLAKLQLDYVGVFSYSKEEGTKAALLPHPVHPSTRKKRKRMLENQLSELARVKFQSQLGQTHPVLYEGSASEGPYLLKARLPFQAREIDGHVLINDCDESDLMENLQPGELLNVELTEFVAGHYLGKVLGKTSVGSTTASL